MRLVRTNATISAAVALALLACDSKPKDEGQAAKSQARPDEKKAGAVAQPQGQGGDPMAGNFTLAQALEGLEGTGQLVAKIETNQGTMVAKLFENDTPNTVANFVGLARGKRPFRDPKSGEWVSRPFYDGLGFHRVIPGFMIQGGCPLGNGTGGPGYKFADEFKANLRHEKPGLLSMANAGPGTNGSQFFVTEVPTPHLDNRHTVFGELIEGLDVQKKIANVAADRSRPVEPVVIQKITIARQ